MHWRRKWQPTPVFLPGESEGWRSLVVAVCGIAQSWARLKRLSSSSSSSIPLYIFTTPFLSIHLSMDTGCCRVLTIVSHAPVNIGMSIPFELQFCLHTCPGVGLLDHTATLFSVFVLRNLHTVCKAIKCRPGT